MRKYRTYLGLLAVVALVAVIRLSADTHFDVPQHGEHIQVQHATVTALGTGALTLLDWAKRLDPDGSVPVIVELLSQTNEMLQDISYVEGNLPTGHRFTVRTDLPTVYWRLHNQGITPSKSTTAQVDEQTGILEAWSEVDADLAKLNSNLKAFRLSEGKAFLEAMNQEWASTLWYGNHALAPEEFTGIATRYNSTSGGNGANVLLAGGASSDNTSMYLVCWSPETVFGIFPKGTKAGITHDDYGEVTAETTAGVGGQRLRVLQERWQMQGGLCIKDWRYIVRVANIDVSDLAGNTPPDLIAYMEQAEELIPNSLGRRVWYCNRRVRRYLRKQIRTTVGSGGGITFDNYAGKPVLMFGETPIRRSDAIAIDESLIS